MLNYIHNWKASVGQWWFIVKGMWNRNLDFTKQGRSEKQDATDPITSLMQWSFERMAVFLEKEDAIELSRRGRQDMPRRDSRSLSSLRPLEEEKSQAAFSHSQLLRENGYITFFAQ